MPTKVIKVSTQADRKLDPITKPQDANQRTSAI